MSSITKHCYFRIDQERVINWVPAFAIPAVLIHMWLQGPNFFGFSQPMNFLIVDLFFLNSIHLIFPFVVLATLTPGREYLSRKFLAPDVRLANGVGLIISGIAIYIGVVISFRAFFVSDWIQNVTSFGFFWLWILLPIFHGMKQSFGIGLLINKSIVRRESDRTVRMAVQKFEVTERFYLRIFMGCVMAMLIIRGVSRDYGIMATSFVSLGFFTLGLASIGIVLYHIRREVLFADTHKFVFTLRFVLWMFFAYSQLAAWLIAFTHGVEYVGLISRMLDSESDERASRRAYRLLSVLIMVLVIFAVVRYWLEIHDMSYRTVAEANAIFPLVLALMPTLSIAHYIVDGIIYRFSDPDVRETIGSSLIGFYPSEG